MDIPGLVQTSLNLGILRSEEHEVSAKFAVRSSVNQERSDLAKRLDELAAFYGATCTHRGEYPAWEYKADSRLRNTMVETYTRMYGKKPEVLAIHAGLECGIIGGKYEGLDMISFGPTICFPHSPDEKVEIASVEKFYSFLLHTLANAPLK